MRSNKTISRLLAGLVLTLSVIGFGNYYQPATASQPVALSQQSASSKIMPELADELATNPARLEYLVVLTEQADTGNMISPLKWADKGWYVYNQLRETADRSQAPLRQAVASLGVEQARVLRSYFIVNALLVEGTPQSLHQLAARSDVATLYSTAPQQVSSPDDLQPAPPQPDDSAFYHIRMIKADRVWEQGNDGRGIVVATNERGANYSHPALYPHWRGTSLLPGPDYNWHDAVNQQNTEPYEESGGARGTATLSIMTGDDGGASRIGVAPGASWIACKMIRADFTSTIPIILDCLQWTLAPTDRNDQNPRPDLRPQAGRSPASATTPAT